MTENFKSCCWMENEALLSDLISILQEINSALPVLSADKEPTIYLVFLLSAKLNEIFLIFTSSMANLTHYAMGELKPLALVANALSKHH
jgi:hypothetical protein